MNGGLFSKLPELTNLINIFCNGVSLYETIDFLITAKLTGHYLLIEKYSNPMCITPPQGESSLAELLAGMRPVLHDEIFVFTSLKLNDSLSTFDPIMMFRESEGTTLILTLREAELKGIPFEFPCRMITLNVHSALDAVGFLARVIGRLAALDMGVNPVAGYFHDHLFIPKDKADDALMALQQMTRT